MTLQLSELQDVRVYIRDVDNQPGSYLKGTTSIIILLKKNPAFFKYTDGFNLRTRPTCVENNLSKDA